MVMSLKDVSKGCYKSLEKNALNKSQSQVVSFLTRVRFSSYYYVTTTITTTTTAAAAAAAANDNNNYNNYK